ncbi:MAG: ABC transporter permease [Gammaproteobacteria bacterium]|nr:ABC transporter permease [Gammaproteobacteria bacterium]MBK8133913.1 ABC transporter permease [Gammaproteobacteria bacterium]MBK9426726.1 ABC transporter permease [Gammaproteobacteria bacterium]
MKGSDALGWPAAFWRHRRLIAALAANGVAGRYRGSWFGLLWPFLQPLLLIGVFTLVFAYVMPLKWVAERGAALSFPLFLYSGFVVFSLFSEAVGSAPGLLLGQANLVKKVVFPLEVIPVASVTTLTLFFLMNLGVFMAALAIWGPGIAPTWPYVALFIAPLYLFLVGLSWFLAALTVYVRDIAHVIGLVVSAVMFLTPVFFPLQTVPEKARALLLLNPLTVVIEGLRAVMVEGVLPDWHSLGLLWAVALVVMQLGWWWFRRLREGFADVL